MSYDVCIFDLDGTLTDPKEGITKSYQYALKSFGINEEQENLTRHIGPPLREVFADYYGFSTDKAEEAVAKYRERFADKGIHENKLYDGVPELLAELKLQGKILAVATNKVAEYAKIILNHFDLLRYFDVISGDDFDGTLSRNGKCEIIKIAMNSLEITDKTRVIMIGDRKNDVLGAKDVGIDSAGVLWGYGSRDELITAGATHLAKGMQEMLEIILK